MGRSCLSISEGMHLEIRFKKCGISNQPNVCIFDDPCFSKFGALRGSCPHPGRQFVGHAPSDCPNMEETRNSMQTFNRKKCSHFSPTNIPSAFPSEIGRMYFLSYSLAHQKGIVCSKRQSLFSIRYMLRHAHLIHTFHRSSALFYGNNLCQISWLIYIESLIGRHIVREQLQCHRCRQHHELILHIRQRENFVLLR